MGIFLANPWGLLALAAIPAIVAIHFLQERSRRVRTSTLFLLERSAPMAAGGARLERFRQSLPFWMQVAAATIAAWLLADPRFVRRDSRQTVAVVLDSSASMQACRDETLALLEARLPAWSRAAGRTDWHLLETGPRRPPLHAGPRLADLLAAARERWRPTLGTHDPAPALAVAAALAPAGSGTVILVTDRPRPVSEGVAILSAGRPFANVGFSGGDVRLVDGRPRWRALVTNHGADLQTRTVSVRVTAPGDAAAVGAAQAVAIEPGRSRPLEGPWPEGGERVVLSLTADRFAADDVLPLVIPRPRQVRLAVTLEGQTGAVVARMVRAAEGIDDVRAADTADLVIEGVRDDPATESIQAPATTVGDARTYDPAWIAAEDHPLVRDLAWGGLLSGPAGGMVCGPRDEPLLWKGGKPIVFLRHTTRPGGRRVETLVLNFDVAGSTAARTPAVVVMIGRFVDRVRSRMQRPWSGNVETDQAIDVAVDDDDALSLTIEPEATTKQPAVAPATVPFRGRAPDEVAFFSITRAEMPDPLVTGAAQFADAREADFRTAAAADTLESLRREAALKQSIADPWAPLWLGALAAALVAAWAWTGRDPSPGGKES